MRRRWIGCWRSGAPGCDSPTPTASYWWPPTAIRSPATAHAATVLRTHVRMLLATAGTTGDLDAQTDALLALLEADYVEHQLKERDQSLQALGDAWESLARKLCGR